jgi:hypothetical protein
MSLPKCIQSNSEGKVVVQILAKPGAKQSAITGEFLFVFTNLRSFWLIFKNAGISDEGVGVQIGAPPR